MLLHFDQDCVTARLLGRYGLDTLTDLDKVLSAYEPNYFFNPLYKRFHRNRDGKIARVWDGKHHFLDATTMTFPVGLTRHVADYFRERGDGEIQIQDDRPHPCWWGFEGDFGNPPVDPNLLPGITLEEDQLDALHAFLGVGRGCLALSVNFGKSELAAALAKIVHPARFLFIVPKKGLLTQAHATFEERLGVRVGRLGAGRWRETDRRVTVATMQTCWSQRKTLQEFFAAQHVVVVDEAHTIAKTGLTLLHQIPAPVRLGLSATIKEAPRRMFVEAYLGPILLESSLTDLVERGRAAEPQITMIRCGGGVGGNDYREVYEKGIVKNPIRNRMILDLIDRHVQAGDKVAVLSYALAHGRYFEERLAEKTIPAPFLYNKTPIETIDHVKREFTAGAVPVLNISSIFDFGQNVPAIDVFILAAGGKAPLRTIQRLGRAVRRKVGRENTVLVYDFFDYAHGFLRQHSDIRRNTYRRKGFPARLVEFADV